MCGTVNNFSSLKQNWKAVEQRWLLKLKWISEQPGFFTMDFPLLSKTRKLFFMRLLYSFSLSIMKAWKFSIQKANIIMDKQACKTPPPYISFQAAYKVLLTNICNKEHKTIQLLFKPLAQTGCRSWAGHLAHTCWLSLVNETLEWCSPSSKYQKSKERKKRASAPTYVTAELGYNTCSCFPSE